MFRGVATARLCALAQSSSLGRVRGTCFDTPSVLEYSTREGSAVDPPTAKSPAALLNSTLGRLTRPVHALAQSTRHWGSCHEKRVLPMMLGPSVGDEAVP